MDKDSFLNKIIRRLDIYILFYIMGIGILIEVLDIFGIINISIEPFSILVHLSIILSLLSVLIVKKMSDIETTIRLNDSKMEGALLKKMSDVETTIRLNDSKIGGALLLEGEQFYQKVSEEMMKATRTVNETHFYFSSPDFIEPRADNGYSNTIKSVLKKNNLIYRRIVSINTLEKYKSIKETVQIYGEQNNFHLKYTDRVHDDFPILNVLIFDKTKIFIGIREHVSIEERAIFFENSDIATVFGNYFDHIWEKSDSLKSGKEIDKDLLEKINKELLEKNSPVSTLLSPTAT